LAAALVSHEVEQLVDAEALVVFSFVEVRAVPVRFRLRLEQRRLAEVCQCLDLGEVHRLALADDVAEPAVAVFAVVCADAA